MEIETISTGKFKPVAVTKVPMRKSEAYYAHNCDNCRKEWGTLGLCKKHSPVLGRYHMTTPRFIYWSFRNFFKL